MRLAPRASKVNTCKMYNVNMSQIGARTKRSSKKLPPLCSANFVFIAVQLISFSTIQNKFSCSRASHANMSALKEKQALSALKETSLKWIMDTLTVCSLPLKRGSRRQQRFFFLSVFPDVAFWPRSRNKQWKSGTAISYILSNWNAGSHNLSMD